MALYMQTGTGKTLTALHKFKELPATKLLIICPHSVINQWKDVIMEELPDLHILEFKQSWSAKRKDQELWEKRYNYDVVIVNFEIVERLQHLSGQIDKNWMIIVDEIHRIKGWGTKRNPVKITRAVCELGKKTEYKAGLTATPTQGKFGGFLDYYPQLLFLGYTDLSYEQFYEKHVDYKLVKFGTTPMHKEIVGYKNKDEVESILKLIARRYTSSYEDFEPQHIKVPIPRAKDYPVLLREKALRKDDAVILMNNSARKRIALKTMTTGVVLGKDMLGTDHIIENNKHKLDWLAEFLEDTDEVVSIFYQYNVELHSLERLMKRLKKRYVIINGATKDKYKEINRKDYDVVIGQFQAMSESLDGLHNRCHISVFFAMPESSLVYKQSIGRIDRIGQTKVPMYYYLLMERTIDEDIMNLIEQKIEFSEITLEKLEVSV
ncbi:MAG: DEAD/DEAH box helicase [Bacteroidales bacterium]|nr:DEAD/DEAH box helicase [Bacteroidales bacterium]